MSRVKKSLQRPFDDVVVKKSPSEFEHVENSLSARSAARNIQRNSRHQDSQK